MLQQRHLSHILHLWSESTRHSQRLRRWRGWLRPREDRYRCRGAAQVRSYLDPMPMATD